MQIAVIKLHALVTYFIAKNHIFIFEAQSRRACFHWFPCDICYCFMSISVPVVIAEPVAENTPEQKYVFTRNSKGIPENTHFLLKLYIFG